MWYVLFFSFLFSLYLAFNSLTTQPQYVFLSVYPPAWCFLILHISIFHQILGKNWPLFLYKCFASFFLSSLFSSTLITCMLDCLISSIKSLKHCSFLFFNLCLSFTNWEVISIHLYLSLMSFSLHLHSAVNSTQEF